MAAHDQADRKQSVQAGPEEVLPEGHWNEIKTPRWRQRLSPAHIHRRLRNIGVFGPKRAELGANLRLLKKQFRHGLSLSADAFRRPVDWEPLFVITTARSGSSWLGELLGSHPDVSWGGEVWSDRRPKGLPFTLMPKWLSAMHLEQNLALQARRQPCRYSAVKIMVEHIAFRHFSLDEFERRWPTARIIVLVRRSLGLRYVSLQQAFTTREFAQRNPDFAPAPPIHADLADFRDLCVKTENKYRALANHSIGQRALWLVYEALDGDPHPILDTCVWPYLGLPRVQTSSRLIKQRRGTVADRVSNYDEVSEELLRPMMPVDLSHNDALVLGPPKGLL